jgi:hypothetical protein
MEEKLSSFLSEAQALEKGSGGGGGGGRKGKKEK